MSHAINHTCDPDTWNCKFIHTGITSDPVVGRGAEDKGGVGGRRTNTVFVKAMTRVERDAEFFGNYLTKFRFAAG